jgi:hypothetical protein
VSKPFFETTLHFRLASQRRSRNLAKPNKRLPVHGRQQDQITRLGQHNIEEGGDFKGLVAGASSGKFPRVLLAESDYRAIARSDGRTYERNFKVIAGVDGEVEVMAR